MLYYIILHFILSLSPGSHERTTLHAIVHLPVKTFNKDVVTIATHCWQWLIAACPELEFKVMRERERREREFWYVHVHVKSNKCFIL